VIPFVEGADIRAAFAQALGLTDRVQDLDLSEGPRQRSSARVASILATQSVVRSAVEAHPHLDLPSARFSVASGLRKVFARRDETPALTKLALPRDLVLPLIQAIRNPAAAVQGTSWQMQGAHWDCAGIVEDASPLMSDDWVLRYRAACDDLLTHVPPALVEELVNAPTARVQSGLGRLVDEKKLKQALEKAGEVLEPQASASPAPSAQASATGPVGMTTIPRIMVQYWNPVPPPADVVDLMGSWPRVNPGFRYESFDKARAIAYAQERGDLAFIDALERAWHPAMESDLLRLLFLFHEGGYYFDADHEALDRIENHISEQRELVLVRRDNGVIVNGVLGATRGQPLIERVLRVAVEGALKVKPKENFWDVTGPGLLTREYKRWIAEDGSREARVTMIPWNSLRNTFHRIYNELPYKAEH
jgi:mannosyltransferase OCH1-like enzyme